MRYKSEWKGRLVVSGEVVKWDGVEIGRIHPHHKEGAKSPGGMVTNTVFIARKPGGLECRPLPSMTVALEWLIGNRVYGPPPYREELRSGAERYLGVLAGDILRSVSVDEVRTLLVEALGERACKQVFTIARLS